jgi:transketolase
MIDKHLYDTSYRSLALKIRRHVLYMTHYAKASHIGSCFSIADILAVLYTDVLRVNPAQPDWVDRDRFILSKGHAAAAVYAALAERGFFPQEWLNVYCQDGARLSGHMTYGVPGVEVSTGSLGHGLSIGCGIALAGMRNKHNYRVFVLISDGECDEGSIWEAALFASHHHLNNLTTIVDYNQIQAFGNTREVLDLEPLAAKWQAFGWAVREIDGHNYDQIAETLKGVPFHQSQPVCIIAHTIKGKGISFMENQVAWHYKSPDADQLRRALVELERQE